jgi:hypothetical protein
VQVSPVLVRVSDGTTRWAGEPTVVAPADAFTVQGVLATEVADALDVALAPAERTRLAAAGTRDTAAFAAVERGRRILQASDTLAYPSGSGGRCASSRPPTDATRVAPRRGARRRSCCSAWGSDTGNTALLDSAAVLARRALALDPGDARPSTRSPATSLQNDRRRPRARWSNAPSGRTPRAPSSACCSRSRVRQAGDTAPARPGPRHSRRSGWRRGPCASSTQAFRSRSRCAATARRRAGRAAPGARPRERPGDWFGGRRRGGRGRHRRVARALRAYQAKGGRVRASDPGRGAASPLLLMRYADRATGDALLAGTPASFGAEPAWTA